MRRPAASTKCFKLVIVLALFMTASAASGQTPAFTYQGRLQDGGTPANGIYDLQFKLFDTQDVGTGTQQGSTVMLSPVQVTAGIFTVQLDFSPCATCFDGSARFLEIAVKQTSGSTFTTLSPRQPLSSTPYALRSITAANATTADGLSVACLNCVTSSQIQSVQGSQVTGNIAGSQIDGTIPVASVPSGSSSYVQNSSSQQASSNFNISGDGTAGGTLTGNIVNAAMHYRIAGNHVLSNAGSNNLFAGVGAGANTTGAFNSFFGHNAGVANTTAVSNSFFGANAGQLNTTGIGNSFFGKEAGRSNSTGASNSFFGGVAGSFNSTGEDNSFFGANAGFFNNGSSNSFFGESAGIRNTSGSRNTFIGQGAGLSNITESDNTFVGFRANGTAGITHATAIGARSVVNASNSLVLGSINGVNGATTDTNVGIGTTAPSGKLHVADASGGNGSVILPSNAIAAAEILDEPGVASAGKGDQDSRLPARFRRCVHAPHRAHRRFRARHRHLPSCG